MRCCEPMQHVVQVFHYDKQQRLKWAVVTPGTHYLTPPAHLLGSGYDWADCLCCLYLAYDLFGNIKILRLAVQTNERCLPKILAIHQATMVRSPPANFPCCCLSQAFSLNFTCKFATMEPQRRRTEYEAPCMLKNEGTQCDSLNSLQLEHNVRRLHAIWTHGIVVDVSCVGDIYILLQLSLDALTTHNTMPTL